MQKRLAALAAWVAACVVAWPATAADRLTLDDAIRRVAAIHPELRLFGPRAELLEAERERALLRPPLVAGATLENALGTGDVSGLDGAETTLTLASVLERGGKLDARRTLAQSRIDALAVEREMRRLDLLAEVARRYLAVVAARHRIAIAAADIAQRQPAVVAARQRLSAGASPESVVLTAEAALARAELDRARSEEAARTARQYLAALWGEPQPTFEVADADPATLPAIDDLGELLSLLDRTPELARFADERRIREARLQLARTEATTDIGWQIGVRRLETSDDLAVVAGMTVPLGAARRARPSIRAAEADLAALEIEREATGVSLLSTLTEAHGRYSVARLEVQRLRDDVLPRLGQAEHAAARAYAAGAISYLEWAQLQAERTSAGRQQLEAALEAQRALIEIQRLTGQAFIATPAAPAEGAKP